MNRETLKQLELSENLRVSAVAALAINTDTSFADAEKKLDAMVNQCKYPSWPQN